jgi:general secretion pathway protein G
MKRNAFTMIELVFVIVVLGILAAIAIPRLAATRDDAQIVKGRSDVAAIRAAIVNERQTRLLQGESAYINQLHAGAAGTKATLFDNNGTATTVLMQYGVATQDATNGHWDDTVAADGTRWEYTFRATNTDVTFDYDPANGTFTCDRVGNAPNEVLCRQLVD